MATKIVTKNSSTASAVPTASDLVQGELAVNVADKRLFTEDNGGAIVELGVNPAAEITANAGIALPDSQKATFGASDDLEIYHNGSHSIISDVGTGNLKLGGTGLELMNGALSEYYLAAIENAGVYLYYDNAAKLATTSTGIDVTGTATMDGLTVDGAALVSSGNTLTLNRTDNAIGGTMSYVAGTGFIFNDANGDGTSFNVGAANRVRIDASGKVGIGTSSPSSTLDIAGETRIYPSSGTAVLRLGSGGVEKGKLSVDTSSNMMFETAGSERMRIDSSGNLLVGTTDSTLYNNTSGSGTMVNSFGRLDITRNDVMAIFNRNTSDGEMINFRKDGTTVGSIGTANGDAITIGNSTGNLILWAANVAPASTASGGASDGVVNLGTSARRFKDLYLSGGVYLGGTGAANKLDDYEEGTWTLSISTSGGTESLTISNTTGSYIKIGNKVTATIYTAGMNISAEGSGNLYLGGLPFNCKSGNESYAVPSFGHTNCFSYEADGYVAVSQNNVLVTRVGTVTANALTVGNPRYMMFTVTYFTD